MFKFQQIINHEYFAFVSWKKDNSMNYANVVIFDEYSNVLNRDRLDTWNQERTLMESWIPDQELYETKIVVLSTKTQIEWFDNHRSRHITCTGKMRQNEDGFLLEIEDLNEDVPGKFIPVIGLRYAALPLYIKDFEPRYLEIGDDGIEVTI